MPNGWTADGTRIPTPIDGPARQMMDSDWIDSIANSQVPAEIPSAGIAPAEFAPAGTAPAVHFQGERGSTGRVRIEDPDWIEIEFVGLQNLSLSRFGFWSPLDFHGNKFW